jgi:hypothetical protein
VRIGGGERTNHRGYAGVVTGQPDHLRDCHMAVGQGPRLIEADHVGPSQHLHTGQLLRDHAAPREAHRGNGEHNTGEENESFGNHRHQPGKGRPHRLDGHVVGMYLADDQCRAKRDHEDGDDEEKPVDASSHL